jgi:hypothetical protein
VAPGPDPPASSGWGQIWGVLSGVVAPVTLVTAVLFYFGYVSTRAQFAYFGVDVDTLGFSTQDFVLRAPQSLLVPTLALLLVSVVLVVLDGAVRRRVGRAGEATARRVLRYAVGGGLALLAAGIALVALYPLLDSWVPYPLVTPLVIGLGALVLERGLAWRRPAAGGDGVRRSRVERPMLLLVVVAAAFWATATVAQWSGTGAAQELAADLTALPEVVVDTTERLHPGDATIEELPLEPDGDGYAYRYRGLRLLAAGEDSLLVVPWRWTPSGSTFVLPWSEVRVKYRFVNDPPLPD